MMSNYEYEVLKSYEVKTGTEKSEDFRFLEFDCKLPKSKIILHISIP